MRAKILICVAAAAAAAAAAVPAAAEDNFQIGLTGGTLGIGPEAAYRVNPYVGVRANLTFLTVSRGFETDGIHYNGRLKLKSGGAMVDLYPFKGGFRVSAGARINGNGGSFDARPTEYVTIGETEYSPEEVGTLSGSASTRSFAPALTLGYGGKVGKGFLFTADAGLLFQGSVRINEFKSSTGLINTADLESERQRVQDEVDKYKVYPIVQLGIAYRF